MNTATVMEAGGGGGGGGGGGEEAVITRVAVVSFSLKPSDTRKKRSKENNQALALPTAPNC